MFHRAHLEKCFLKSKECLDFHGEVWRHSEYPGGRRAFCALKITTLRAQLAGCHKYLFLRVNEACHENLKGVDEYGRVSELSFSKPQPTQCSQASQLNPSQGLGDKGQGRQARQPCDDIVVHILSRGAEACPAQWGPSGWLWGFITGCKVALEIQSEDRWFFSCKHTII